MNPSPSSPNFAEINNIIENDLSYSSQSITKRLLKKYKPKSKFNKIRPIDRTIDLRDAA